MKTRLLLLSIAVVMSAGAGAGTAPPLVAQCDCKADPHALLFAVVDKHVRRLGVAAPR